MRQSAEWMRPIDERILETIRSEGNLTPQALSRDGRIPRVDTGRKYAGQRCRLLTKYGLLVKVDKGLYAITERGERYLDQEADASTFEVVDDEDDRWIA